MSDSSVVSPASPGRSRRTGVSAGARAGILIGVAVALSGMLLALGFLVTSTPLGMSITAADTAFLQWLQGLRTAPLDTLTDFGSRMANTETVIVVGIIAAIVARWRTKSWWAPGLLAVAVVGEVVLFAQTALIIGRTRPPVEHLDAVLPPTSSFPSGHTGAAIALYGGIAALLLLSPHTARWWRIVAPVLVVLIVLVVAFSRLYRGAHFPSDTVGAVLFAVPWLLTVIWVFRPRE